MRYVKMQVEDIITNLSEITDFNKIKVVPQINYYWLTEKYDGYRALCINGKLYTRNGNQIICPEWFSKLLPHNLNLDGELYTGYNNWNMCGNFRRKHVDEKFWLCDSVMYIVFDVIDDNANTQYHQRYEKLLNYVISIAENGKTIIPKERITFPIRIVKYEIVNSRENLMEYFNQVTVRGGEGVIFRNPLNPYFTKSKDNIFRLKKIYLKEGVIVDYKMSTSQKYSGLISSFIVVPICECDDEIKNLKKGQLLKQYQFSVSSGITEYIRKTYKKTFPIGTIIQYKCNDYTSTGKPRHPVFIRKREGYVLTDMSKQISEETQIKKYLVE